MFWNMWISRNDALFRNTTIKTAQILRNIDAFISKLNIDGASSSAKGMAGVRAVIQDNN